MYQSYRCTLFLNSNVMNSSDVVIAGCVRLGFCGNVLSLDVDTIGEHKLPLIETLKDIQFELHVIDVVEVNVSSGVKLLVNFELESFHFFNNLIEK